MVSALPHAPVLGRRRSVINGLILGVPVGVPGTADLIKVEHL